MNKPKDLGILRDAILIDAYTSSPNCLTTERIELNLKISDVTFEKEKLEAQLQYLVDSEYLVEPSSELSKGNKNFRISHKGVDYLEGAHFV